MKNLYLVLISLFLSTGLLAQKHSLTFELGLLSSITADQNNGVGKTRRNSPFLSALYHYHPFKNISFSSGLQYLAQGYRHKTCYTFPEGVKNMLTGKLDYLALPLLVNGHLGKSQRVLTSFGMLGAVNIRAAQDHPEPIGGCAIGYLHDVSAFVDDFYLAGMVSIAYQLLNFETFQICPSIKYIHNFTESRKNFQSRSFAFSLAISI